MRSLLTVVAPLGATLGAGLHISEPRAPVLPSAAFGEEAPFGEEDLAAQAAVDELFGAPRAAAPLALGGRRPEGSMKRVAAGGAELPLDDTPGMAVEGAAEAAAGEPVPAEERLSPDKWPEAVGTKPHLWPKQEARRQQQQSRFFLFGAHHKSGTVVMRHLANVQTELLEQPPCVDDGCKGGANRCTNKRSFFVEPDNATRTYFACSVEDGMISALRQKAAQSNTTFRGVHVIRDPLALVVSGYLYHMHSNDHLPDPAIRHMSLELGIAFEAEYVLNVTLKEMVAAYERSQSENGTSYDDVLNVRLEDLMRSSDDYDRTAEAIFNHTLGDMSTPYLMKRLRNASIKGDLRRNPMAERGSEKVEGDFLFGHVADAEMKQKAMQALKQIPPQHMEALLRARSVLGYPEPQ